MEDIHITSEQKLEQVRSFSTAEDFETVRHLMETKFRYPDFRNALFERVSSLLQTMPRPNTSDHVQQDGVTYDLAEWITLADYASRYGLKSTNTITNWIARSVVPADCIVELRALNGLRLIRNQPYRNDNE